VVSAGCANASDGNAQSIPTAATSGRSLNSVLSSIFHSPTSRVIKFYENDTQKHLYNFVSLLHKLTQLIPMQDTQRILVVDDHAEIREPLATFLHRYGFQVVMAQDGKEMRAILAESQFDLIILDVMLPGEDGLSLCRFVCEHLGTPVILLSALGESGDRIAGLEIGADDYVNKPFDPRELVARIKSVIRRTRPSAPSSLPHRPRYRFANWLMDPGKIELRDQQKGELVELGDAEFRLLHVLVENPRTILSRERLLDLTSQQDASVFDRSIDSLISRLRRKLGDDARNPQLLRTVWGNGYIFTADVTLSST
jgi:two-component system OmpR family response regulator